VTDKKSSEPEDHLEEAAAWRPSLTATLADILKTKTPTKSNSVQLEEQLEEASS
jgi:hypothetical protein